MKIKRLNLVLQYRGYLIANSEEEAIAQFEKDMSSLYEESEYNQLQITYVCTRKKTYKDYYYYFYFHSIDNISSFVETCKEIYEGSLSGNSNSPINNKKELIGTEDFYDTIYTEVEWCMLNEQRNTPKSYPNDIGDYIKGN